MPTQTNGRNRRANNNQYGGLPDFMTLNRVKSMVQNAATSLRRSITSNLFDPRRDIEDECGYPKLEESISPQKYKLLYDRFAIATRVVELYPKESWQVQPDIKEGEDAETDTPFIAAWKDVCRSLLGGNSYYRSDEGNPIWNYLLRADVLSGIGRYGIILLGLNDGLPLDQPVRGVTEDGSLPAENMKVGTPVKYGITVNAEQATLNQLQFLRVFSEDLAPITRWESNPNSPRFGQPTSYTLQFNSEDFVGVGRQAADKQVHWSRIIHVTSDTLLDGSDIFSRPWLQPVYNRILDLRKLYGGSAEMYWKGAFFGLSFETPPQLGGDVDIDLDDLKDQLENYFNGLQRYLALTGLNAKTLSPTVVDPTPQIERQIEAICIALDCPKRIFMGSERGELSSAQDQGDWDDTLMARQRNHVTPRLIIPLIDRFIMLGLLPEPGEDGYQVNWPDLTDQTEESKANNVLKRTQALAQYVGGDVQQVIAPFDFLVRELGYSEEEANAIIDNAMERIIEEEIDIEDEEGEEEDADNPNPTKDNNPNAGEDKDEE